MAISIGAGFALHKKLVIDDRTLFDTVADMVATPENWMADMGYAFVKENGKMYIYNSANEVDADLGRWREFSSGEGGELTADITSNFEVGGVKEGATFEAGTSIEEIIKKILVGKTLEEDDFYYGTTVTREVVSLYQFTGGTSSVCSIVADNEYVVFAAKEEFGDFNIQDANGFPYNSDFDKSTLTHNGILYNVYIGKYRLTSPNGFEYRLSFK